MIWTIHVSVVVVVVAGDDRILLPLLLRNLLLPRHFLPLVRNRRASVCVSTWNVSK